LPLFMGQYKHNLDQKNRLFIPAKLREGLGDSFILCMPPNGDKCLFAYTMKDWEELSDRINDQPKSRQLTMQQRFTYYNIDTVEADKQGRITIKTNFCDFAGLDKDVFILGAGRRVEFWNPALWDEMVETAKENGEYTTFDLPY